MRPVAIIVAALCAASLLASEATARTRLDRQDGENRGTPRQRMACTPDVFRLCGEEIPNIPGIVACLIKNKPRLNPDCRAVFEGRLR